MLSVTNHRMITQTLSRQDMVGIFDSKSNDNLPLPPQERIFDDENIEPGEL